MKLSVPLAALVTIAVALPCFAETKEKPLGKDEAAVLAAIDGQIAARWANDFEKWSTYWVHAPYIRRVGSSPTSGVTYIEGWDAIGAAMKEAMAKGAPMPKVTRDNHNVRVYRDSAFVTFDQHGEQNGAKVLTRETRVLEKRDGKWKLIFVGAVAGPDPSAAPKAEAVTPDPKPAAVKQPPAPAK
jgi:hypothetical protein